MTKKLEDALKTQKKKTRPSTPQIHGVLGIPINGKRTVEVPHRNGYVFVRLRDNQSEVIQAFNNKVSPAYNLPVIVERQGNRYAVVEVDSQRYENNWPSQSPYLPRHGNTHSFDPDSGGGGDIVFVHPRQFMPSLILPSGSLGASNVAMASYVLRDDNNTWRYVGNTGTQDIAVYKPTSPTGAIMVLVYLDTVSGNPYLLVGSGTVFSASLTGTSQIVPFIPTLTNANTQIPLSAIRLVTGTNRIVWNNIYDVRQFMFNAASGSAGNSLTIQDEGVSQGTATTLNFVGANVEATVSGNIARIFVTGSIGGASNLTGTSIGLPNRVVLTNSSGFLYTDPSLVWNYISGKLYLEFGADVSGKESNAGRMGYQIFSNGFFEIVGAGTSAGNRWVRLYDNVKVNSHLQTQSFQTLGLLSTYIYMDATGTAVAPINAPELLNITGTDQIMGLNSQNSYSSVRWPVDAMITTAMVPKAVDPAYISGLNISYNTSGSVNVGPGTAYVQATGRLVQVTGTISASLTPSATTVSGSWQHVYLYESSGVANIEVTTTEPSDPYAGVARAKTGDTNRRYLGSVYCNTGGFLRKFNSNVWGNIYKVNWTELANAFPFQFANISGTVTTPTTIPISWLIPNTLGLVQEIVVQTLHSMVAAGDNQIGLSDNNDSSTAVAGMEYASRFTNGAAAATLSQLAAVPIKITGNALKYTHQNIAGTNGGFFRAKGVNIQR